MQEESHPSSYQFTNHTVILTVMTAYMSVCVCVRVLTVRVSAHGEVQHGVAELVLCLLFQLLTQTLQGSLVLNNTNSSQLQSVSE